MIFKKKRQYKYLISYGFRILSVPMCTPPLVESSGTGSSIVSGASKIRNMDDLNEIKPLIEKELLNDTIVKEVKEITFYSFSLLEE